MPEVSTLRKANRSPALEQTTEAIAQLAGGGNTGTDAASLRRGYDRLQADTQRDYLDRKAARTLLAQLNGNRLGLGGSQYGAEEIDRDRAQALNLTSRSAALGQQESSNRLLTSRARAALAGIEATEAGTARALSATEAARRDEADAALARRQATQKQEDADALRAQQQSDRDYQRQLGILCLQQGVMPTEQMLEALEIDADTARYYVNTYRTYGRYL